MNLHVTHDNYGLYPVEIARRIKASPNSPNNMMVNLTNKSKYTDELITYLSPTSLSFKKYVKNIKTLDKIIFHPYNLTSYRFLKYVLKKFPHAKVYWVCWSYEIYSNPCFSKNAFDSFSQMYIKKNRMPIAQKIKRLLPNKAYKVILDVINMFGGLYPTSKAIRASYQPVNYFCSFLFSDYEALRLICSEHNIQHRPLAYLSLEQIMPDLNAYKSKGNKIMIGHSSSPGGNHYEVLKKISTLDNKFSIFIPLAYGDHKYGNIIKQSALDMFDDIEVLEEKLSPAVYYKKLTEVGWAIINAKMQQGIGNIIALLWMGVKIFLHKNTSTYKEFISWGLIIYDIEKDLNHMELTTKLSADQIDKNRRVIWEKLNENKVSEYWKEILY